MKKYSRLALLPKQYLSHVITITSDTGVGSSSLLKAFEKFLPSNWTFVSGGSIMRKFAQDKGMDITEFAQYVADHPEEDYDSMCDEEIALLGKINRTIIEARLAHVFVPHAMHILLACPLEIRVRRRQRDRPNLSLADVEADIRRRDEIDKLRLMKRYPGCIWPPEQFDLVLSTEDSDSDQLMTKSLFEHRDWKNKMRNQLVETLVY